jgi:HEPN domain-containing protein
MNGDETAEQRREAAGWLAIAREDVRVARACLALDPPAFGMAAYHCQQAAEKLTKGLLAAAGVPFRKTHDLNELADLAAAHYPAASQVLDVIRPFTSACVRPECRKNDRHCRFADALLGPALSVFRIGMPSTYGVSFLVVLIAFLLFVGALP